jgi:hypothetical protein
MPYSQYSEQAILNAMFGNVVGQVATTIAAAATAQTSIVTRGSIGSGNIDNTPATGAMIFTGTPGSGATLNTLTAPHAFLNSGGAPTATTFPIASQSMGLALTAGDYIFLGGGSTNTGTTTGIPMWTLNTLYIGLTTQAVSGATQANVLTGEPAIGTAGYARIAILNNRTNFPIASAATPSVLTAGGPFSFPASTGAWASSANLIQMFICDSSTGTTAGTNVNVLAFGALGTAQAVAASGITLSFASGAITITLT